jgi:hypothetical protein
VVISILRYNAVYSAERQQTFRRNNLGSACYLLQAGLWLGLILWARRSGRHVILKRLLSFNAIHGVISQNIEFFTNVFRVLKHMFTLHALSVQHKWKQKRIVIVLWGQAVGVKWIRGMVIYSFIVVYCERSVGDLNSIPALYISQ